MVPSVWVEKPGWQGGFPMNPVDTMALLRRIYGDAMSLHYDLFEKSERHRETHGKECTVYPHSPVNAPIWPLLMAIVPGRQYLEVGCGLGYTTALMAETGGRDSRVDTVEKVLEHADAAEEELERRGLSSRVRVLRGDAIDILPTLRESYDIVFMDADWKDYPSLLPHLFRLTRPGGILFTSNLFPLFEEWASSLPYKERVEEYLIRLGSRPPVSHVHLPQ